MPRSHARDGHQPLTDFIVAREQENLAMQLGKLFTQDPSALQELEGCWAISRADTGSQSVRREPSRWANLVMWRRGHESAAANKSSTSRRLRVNRR
jgi:hypothetical protein